MWSSGLCQTVMIFCVTQQAGVTDVIFAAVFTGCAWELSASVTESSHRKMEELFERPVSVTCYCANLCVGGQR